MESPLIEVYRPLLKQRCVGDVDKVEHGRRTMDVWMGVRERIRKYEDSGRDIMSVDFSKLLGVRVTPFAIDKEGLEQLLSMGILMADGVKDRREFISSMTGIGRKGLCNIAYKLKKGSYDSLLGYKIKDSEYVEKEIKKAK